MRVKGARPVEDLLGPSMSLQERRRRLHRKKEASKVVRFTARLLESNFKRMKRARQLFREIGKGFLLSLEFAKQGEMGIERRASIKSTQVGDHAGKTVGYLTRWDKPEMERTHDTAARIGFDSRLLHGHAFRQVPRTIHVDVA